MTAPRSVIKAATVVSAALVLSRLLGYVREALLASRFGATHVTDAYVVSSELPGALFAALSQALLLVFIPVYRTVLQNQGAEAGRRLANTVLNATLLVSAVLVALGWVFAPMLVPNLVPGLPGQVQSLAVSLTRTMLPMMLFLALSGVFAAVLNANRFFTGPALLGFVSNLAVISVLLVVTGPSQVHWVAWSVVAGALAGALVQLPWLRRASFSYDLSMDLKNPALRQIGRLILPVIVTATAIQMQNFVDRFLASHLAEGSIAALNYAVRVNALPYGVIGAAISTVLYPNLAEYAAAGSRDELQRSVTGGLGTLAFVLLPMSLGLVAFREPIVQVFFQRGAFDPRATAATAYALEFFAAGILFFGWLDFVNRCFFVLQDTLTPMWISLLMVVLNIGFNIFLVRPMAQGGLALGTSMATAIGVGLLLWHLRRRLGGFQVGPLLRSTAGSLASAAVGTLAGLGVYRFALLFVPGARLMAQVTRLGAALGTVVIVHVLLAALLGNREGADLAARLALRFGRSKS